MPYAFNNDKSKFNMDVRTTAGLDFELYPFIQNFIDSLPNGYHALYIEGNAAEFWDCPRGNIPFLMFIIKRSNQTIYAVAYSLYATYQLQYEFMKYGATGWRGLWVEKNGMQYSTQAISNYNRKETLANGDVKYMFFAHGTAETSNYLRDSDFVDVRLDDQDVTPKRIQVVTNPITGSGNVVAVTFAADNLPNENKQIKIFFTPSGAVWN